MTGITALIDANILFSPTLRDLFIEMSCDNLFHARWTDKIHDEWTSAVKKQRPDIPLETLMEMRHLINNSVPDCLVSDYEALINQITLPDENDRHVLAAAIEGQCNFIVTRNVRDFPGKKLKKYDIKALLPHEFIKHFDLKDTLKSAHKVLERLSHISHDVYVQSIRTNRLKALAEEMNC